MPDEEGQSSVETRQNYMLMQLQRINTGFKFQYSLKSLGGMTKLSHPVYSDK